MDINHCAAGSPFIAEAVEKLRAEASFNVRSYLVRTFCSRFRLMPRRVLSFWPVVSWFWRMDQAIIGLGGGLETSLASRLRFCTVAVSRNSSLAPVSPRNRSLVIARLRFASPNNRSIFLRSRVDWL